MLLRPRIVRGVRIANARPLWKSGAWSVRNDLVFSGRRNLCTRYLNRHIHVDENFDVVLPAVRKGADEHGSSGEDYSEDEVSQGSRSASTPTVSNSTYEVTSTASIVL